MAGSSRGKGGLELRAEREAYVRRVLVPVQEFLAVEWVGSGVLLGAAILALVLANSPLAYEVHLLWETVLTLDLAVVEVSMSFHHWVNDGLMALFFLVVGLEIKREVLHGRLSSPRRAALPVVAAAGGMAVPALAFLAFTAGGEGTRGWGIPMATDIAFALGILGLLGRRIPAELRVFLLALAIVDDLGAILVIALFYSGQIAVEPLGAAAVLLAVMMLVRHWGVRALGVYMVLGFLFWIAVLESGVHATLAGVVLGLMAPSRRHYEHDLVRRMGPGLWKEYEEAVEAGDHHRVEGALGRLEELVAGTEAPLERLERRLHPWTAFLVLPLFALVNAGIDLTGDGVGAALASPVALGIVGGLVAGKLVGILGASWLAVRTGLARLPDGVGWRHMAGVSLLAGVGFTVSLFIADLAFTDAALVVSAKLGILVASLLAGAAGFLVLRALPVSGPGGSDGAR